eukprot:gnl/Hemi2/2272_TR808_c0_g3_i1.p1 gnl/Hemi2/2272_TR808_c0_g3~~gnl/Hemi2/2272_TR808_c0_g3_i1.p1  ORF type:complete len:253 (-),score=86.58 gnl/Hemi2/2272_TR808_c0_g3_i1:87-845(-)
MSQPAGYTRGNTVVVFDCDGTLTESGKNAGPAVGTFLGALRQRVTVAVVGGLTAAKMRERLGDAVFESVDYAFPENGLVAFKAGLPLAQVRLQDHVSEAGITEVINTALRYLADLELPFKRGNMIDFRTGLINISPAGRGLAPDEKVVWHSYDEQHAVRATMVAHMQQRLAHLGLKFSIGGQTGFDVFPVGFDKSYCLRFLAADGFANIFFFGDKTKPGENDYEIVNHPSVCGFTTTGPDFTLAKSRELFFG